MSHLAFSFLIPLDSKKHFLYTMTKKHLVVITLMLTFLGNGQHKIDTLDIENYQIKSVKISNDLKEISGLEVEDGFYWGQNDSGGKAEIYKISPTTGKIVQTVKIINAENQDWEDIAFGNGYVFIGDFGNNLGKRKDLAIYYFSKSKLESTEESITVEAQKIEFTFPEQKEFNVGNKKTNYDCEALFFYNGKLHLFTKEWTKLETTHYTLEVKAGKQAAKRIESFKTNYMVTGATVDDNPISNTNGFYLIGYTPDGFGFISGFSLPKKGNDILFDKRLSKFSLPLGFTVQVGQTEGISIKKEKPNVICFSNEDFKIKSFHVEQSVQCIYSLAQ